MMPNNPGYQQSNRARKPGKSSARDPLCPWTVYGVAVASLGLGPSEAGSVTNA